MARSGFGIKLLSSLVLVTGILALGGASAQAETGANWMVNGTNVNGTLLPEVQVKELVKKVGSLLFTTKAGTQVIILCEVLHIIFVRLWPSGALVSIIIIGLNCVVDLNGKASAACKPHSPGEPAGTIKSKELTGLMVLHEGSGIVSVKPTTGTTLANIELGESCAIGEEIPLAGQFTVKDSQGEFSVEKVEHGVEEGPLSSITALGQAATLDGSAIVKLGGVHAGLKFSGLPG
jgi:hypothetical protein